jgi:hypothetical protein
VPAFVVNVILSPSQIIKGPDGVMVGVIGKAFTVTMVTTEKAL